MPRGHAVESWQMALETEEMVQTHIGRARDWPAGEAKFTDNGLKLSCRCPHPLIL
jgi:hypothetical protein